MRPGVSNRIPPPASAHSPGFGEAASLAVHLKHPAVVGKQQLQGLAEEEDARHPDPRGEDSHADQCPCLGGLVGAISVREGERAAGAQWSSLREILTLRSPCGRCPISVEALKEEDSPGYLHNYTHGSTWDSMMVARGGGTAPRPLMAILCLPSSGILASEPTQPLLQPRSSPLRKVSLDVTDQPLGNVQVAVGRTHCCHDDNQPAGRAARIHTPEDAIL